MLAHIHNLSTEEEDSGEFEAGLGHTVGLQIKKPEETKDHMFMISSMWSVQKSKLHEGREWINDPRDSEGEEMGSGCWAVIILHIKCRVILWEWWTFRKLDDGNSYPTPWIH